jgi:L-alanine-DL-glutamate epimerase-like enolase superfamily enzyme
MESARTSVGASAAFHIDRVDVSAYVIPTDAPESDGTFEWRSTTLVVVEPHAAGRRGLGYTYADRAAATVVAHTLAPAVIGIGATDVPAAWAAMQRSVRNAGRPGIASTAISALDSALWDLKARLLDVPLAALLGTVRAEVPVYGSGGFTSYSVDRLQEQLARWVDDGIRHVKMKVGREAGADPLRVRAAREAIGNHADLFVDANGAWTPAAARAMAQRFAPYDVTWFEEPVSSDDLAGLRRVRDDAPAGMEIAAGEYGYDIAYFRRMLESGAVDVLQADATRCGGITGFLQVGALCDAFDVPLSAHTAPTLHAAVSCALPRVRHVEYFHDHVRLERMLFDGAPLARDGCLRPDRTRPGLGLELKRADAARFQVA